MLLLHLLRFSTVPELFTWWMPVAVLAAMLLADFVSGVIHWIADTWGSETMPVLGRRFLRPFRVHHINPDDPLRRDFIDTNGDVAMIAIPFLLSAFLIPLNNGLGWLATAVLVAFSACALPTNQVHQWAHMRNPPAWVCRRRRGLILSRERHQRHHTAPYAMNYCIITGWCKWPLTALGFFPALERVISHLTALNPRSDDLAFAARLEASATGRPDAAAEKSS